MDYSNFRIISRTCILFLLIYPIFVKSVSLDNTGSYKLVVAIDEKTAQNLVTGYVENIKIGLRQLSEVLYSSTNSKFSIQEVDILIPSHWNAPFDAVATTQYYEEADIKISHMHSLPLVDNPNPCGRAGSAMLLPYNFFDDPNNSSYGDVGNALLTQFVRFRYGAWEEHGYPGDILFPYFWKDEDSWEVNACTDSKILGEFKNIEDNTDCSPQTGDEYPPITECRYIPSDEAEQTATSSIMSYHYLPTIEKFCDSQTHNRKQPTPQNFFCKYLSIMEVIQSSSDWKGVSQPNDPAPEMVFKVVKNSASPLLYILLDSGISQAPSTVMSEISAALRTLVEDSVLPNVVATVAKYPADNKDDLVTEIVPWSSFAGGRNQFIAAFNTTFGRRPGFRDFGGALAEAVRTLAERDHPRGSMVLMVKAGIETDTASLSSESSVLTQLLLSKVKIFAIEIQGSDIQPAIALGNVILKSEGVHLPLSSSSNYTMELGEFIQTLREEMRTEIEINRGYVMAIHDIIPNDGPVELKVNSSIKSFEAFVIPLSGTITNPIFKYTSAGNVPDLRLEEMRQWNSTSTSASTKVYYNTATYGNPLARIFWDVFTYTCSSGEDCSVLVQVFVQVADISLIPPVTLQVSTSAENSVVDLAVEHSATDLGTPFGIYAKLEQGSIPLSWTDGLDVFAYIVQPETAEVYKVELKDDGGAVPDVSRNDGIFSGTFVPTSNGLHNIFVSVKYRIPPPPKHHHVKNITIHELQSSRSVGKLFPVDQVHVGCGSSYSGCWYESPKTEFIVSQTLSKPVEFRNVDRYIPMAHRIVDLSVTPMSQLQIKLEWTGPGVFLPNNLEKIDSYQIKHSDDFDKLLEDFDNAEDLFPPSDLPVPGDPGSEQSVTFAFAQEADRYFAIKGISSLSGANPPAPVTSLIIRANIRTTVIPTTTTTTTTRQPPTSTSTAAPTTQSIGTGPTWTEEVATTIRTSNRTSIPTSTTPRLTEPPTTTRKPTPTPLPSSTPEPTKHWFETKEGLITIGVFGGGMVVLFLLGLIIIVKFRR